MNADDVVHIKAFARSLVSPPPSPYPSCIIPLCLWCAQWTTGVCVCVRAQTTREEGQPCVAPGARTWSKQSLSVRWYTNSTEQRESWQRDTGTEREKGGLGRAAEIREHRSVFNQGYVEVRERQRALLLAHLSLEEHVKGKVDGG